MKVTNWWRARAASSSVRRWSAGRRTSASSRSPMTTGRIRRTPTSCSPFCAAKGVHATFFVVGRAVAAYPDVVRREVLDGNAIGNHTWSHEHLVLDGQSGLRRTLERTDRAIFEAAGVHTRIMRPPFGGRDWLVLGEVRKLGYTPVMWSVPLANDWEYPPARVIAARVLRYVGDGAIIALHDGNRGLVCARMHAARTPLRSQRRRGGDAFDRRGAQAPRLPLRHDSRAAADAGSYAYSLPCKRMNPPRAVVLGVVMRPMNDRQPSRIVHHLAADLDRVARLDRAARRDGDIIDDFQRAGAARDVEGLVHAVRPRAVEEARRRGNGPREVNPRRRPARVGGSQIHRGCHHAQRCACQGRARSR